MKQSQMLEHENGMKTINNDERNDITNFRQHL
jgi:hypothetical protein